MTFIDILQYYSRAEAARDQVTMEVLEPVITAAKRMAGRRGRKCSVTDEEAVIAIKDEIGKMERKMALAGPTHGELRRQYENRKSMLEGYLREFEEEA